MISNDWWWPPVHSQSSCVCWWWPDYWGCCRHKIGENIEIWIFENIIITIMFNIGETENHTSRAPLWLYTHQFETICFIRCSSMFKPESIKQTSKQANKTSSATENLNFWWINPWCPTIDTRGVRENPFLLDARWNAPSTAAGRSTGNMSKQDQLRGIEAHRNIIKLFV